VHDLPVDIVHFLKFAKIEASRCLDEMGLRSMGVWVTEGGDDDRRKMDELGIYFQDLRRCGKLRFESMTR
jgi:hypothetical protein